MVNIIENIKKVVKEIGGDVYIVGGYIRDRLLNNKEISKDLDLIYDGDIKLLKDKLILDGFHIITLKDEKQIYRAMLNDNTVDIALINGDSIEEDLGKRDFTINSIALKLIDNKIIDPFNGRRHLNSKLIHPVSENSIRDDNVRILRAYRFAIKYGMHFSKECEKQIIDNKESIMRFPKERIFNEFMGIIKCDKFGRAFEELDTLGVLKILLPYIEELKTVGKCKYHIEDAFTHMNLAYKNSKAVLNGELSIEGLDLNIFDKDVAGFLMKEYFSFAAFCHDIGKFVCYKNKDGRVSFIGHDKEGAKIIFDVCNKLGFPKEAKKFICNLTEAHMYPLGLCKNNVKNYKKSFYKFFLRYNKYIQFILALSFCDMHATKMLYDPNNEEKTFKSFLEKLYEEYKEFQNSINSNWVDGKLVIEITGAEGEDIKKVLNDVYKKLYYKELNNKEDVLKYLNKIKL
ncbi:tRNA nucleotidyltransferase [Clostridium novyi A str. 4552]|uniref:tRNA nucleotidyltransferase n=1 Tax=Clostridium novyi A str. 4552 TaxID=1444289 RepID=A0A0A0I512_CLONO|nr:HD domain-containing protein [Clostridium novyi]KGM96494.1 tRNA nucleotidyltransferase [Clostridium novyi A str. 4552]